jgi:hypothetical protein
MAQRSAAKVVGATVPKKTKRSYKLGTRELKELLAQAKAAKRFPNPYRIGFYWTIVEALVALGINKWHSVAQIMQHMAKELTEQWTAFECRQPRNLATGLDPAGRLIQNLRTLQRTKDYGQKLLQVGAVVDLKRDRGNIFARLNARSKRPQKAGRPAKSSR